MENSKNKKVTIHDVAAFCGVSIATVSYVLNGHDEEKISPQTKEKVLHAANFLNYKPNPIASALAGATPSTVAFFSGGFFRDHAPEEYDMVFIHRLYEKLSEKGLSFLLLGSRLTDVTSLSTQAIILMNLDEETFHHIAAKSFMPVLAVDSIVTDPIFFHVYDDYPSLISEAKTKFCFKDFVFVSSKMKSLPLKAKIAGIEGFKGHYDASDRNLKKKLSQKNGQRVIVFGEENARKLRDLGIRGAIVLSYDPRSTFKRKIPLPLDKKIDTLLDAVNWAAARMSEKPHDIPVANR